MSYRTSMRIHSVDVLEALGSGGMRLDKRRRWPLSFVHSHLDLVQSKTPAELKKLKLVLPLLGRLRDECNLPSKRKACTQQLRNVS